MLLVKQEKLHFKDEKSDKVYEIEMFHIQDDEYVVNFKYGRRGRRLNEGTKTVFPVPKEKAEKVFQDLIDSKVKKGYIIVQEYSDDIIIQPIVDTIESDASVAVILKYLKDRVDSKPQQPNWKLSRIIWRAGQMKIEAAVPLVHELMPWLSGQEIYASIWLMGRVASPQCLENLMSYKIDYDSLHYNIYIAALLKSGDRTQDQSLIDILPLELKTSYQRGDFVKFEEVANQYLFTLKVDDTSFLLNAYFLSINNNALRKPLRKLLAQIKLVPGKWKYVRSIYKIAEMIDDGDTLGILSRRINSINAYYNNRYGNFTYLGGESINIKEQYGSKDSKLAFSKKTKQYFIRRSLKHLMQLGNDRQESYCNLASGLLKAYDESDYSDHKQETVYSYDSETRSYNSQVRFYPGLAHIPYIYYIMYNRGDRFLSNKNSKYYYVGEAKSQTLREDSYPSLWNKYPRYAVELLADCRLKEVMDFSIRILNECKDIEAYITSDIIVKMLKHPFNEVVEFSFDFIKKRYNSTSPDIETITLLIESENERAIDLALGLIDLNAEPFIKDKSFVLKSILIEHDELQNWLRTHVKANHFIDSDIDYIIENVFEHYYQLTDDTFKSESAETFITIFKDHLSKLDPNQLLQMIEHSQVQIQLFGAKLININEIHISEWPDSLLLKMLSSEHDQIRQEGMTLFSKLTDEDLLKKDKYISELASSEYKDLRLKAREIIGRLAPKGQTFSENVFNQLFQVLLEKHEDDELPLDVYETIQLHLKDVSFIAFNDNTEAFLKSNKREVQLLTQDFIASNPETVIKWSVEYWALMGRHDSHSIRNSAIKLFESNVDKVKYGAFEAVKILDTEWDDTFDLGAKYFDDHFDNHTWTPELIISLCDSTITRVQDYGTSVLSRFFIEENGAKYLESLSEHPDSVIQLYCTNYLDRFAYNNDEILVKLKPYFIRALSGINTRRVAKLRVFSFLERQSEESIEKAKFVAQILNEVVGTIAILENEKYVGLLHNLEKKHSSIESELEILPLEIRS